MAGLSKSGAFSEKVSPFLRLKIEEIKRTNGELSSEYLALFLQYFKLPKENEQYDESNNRHWEADLNIQFEESTSSLRGFERLYRQSVVIEPTMICAAHCRYCLRANYEIFTLSETELKDIAIYCGSNAIKDDVSEVLISGGDPFIVPQKLSYLVESIIEYAPNVQRIRIGTRLPLHDPKRVDNNIFEIFNRNRKRVHFEIATQINHPVELFSEAIEKFRMLQDLGVTIYSQNVLLKGINDNIETLVKLYEKLRDLHIEAHYLFHSVPMRGMHHFRTSVQKGLELANQLTNSGVISGRIKPMYALMTDIGKITLYDGSIISKTNKELLIQSSYNFNERKLWNPSWLLPTTAKVDSKGNLQVYYLDGQD